MYSVRQLDAELVTVFVFYMCSAHSMETDAGRRMVSDGHRGGFSKNIRRKRTRDQHTRFTENPASGKETVRAV